METPPARKKGPSRTIRPGEVPLPHSLEAEEALLGTILLDSASMAVAVEHLTADDFFLDRHQRIFKAMLHLFEGRGQIDTVSVGEVLKIRGDLDLVGGPATLTHLLHQAISPGSMDAHAAIIRDRALVRRMIQTASAIVSEGYEAETEPQEYLDRSERRVLAIREEQVRGSVVPLSQAVDESMEKVRLQYQSRNPNTGVNTGYQNLNRLLGGFQPSDLVIIAARPSMGKTAFALNLAMNAAQGYRAPNNRSAAVLFCSLEMNQTQITERLLSMKSQVDMSRLRTGRLTESEMRLLEECREQMKPLPIFLDDSPRMSVLELRAKARRLQWTGSLDLVMVDYLQLMEPGDKRVSREQQISEISRSLKALAKELEVPVVALSQLSRAPEQRTGNARRPMLSDLRESGAIEQDADVVMFLYRPEYYNKEPKEEERGILEVIVEKQRNGPTGTVKFVMRKETLTVAEIITPPGTDS